MRYKKTPILVKAFKQPDMAVIARNFLAASESIDVGIAEFIYARLMEYPTIPSMLYARHTDQLDQNTIIAPDKV